MRHDAFFSLGGAIALGVRQPGLRRVKALCYVVDMVGNFLKIKRENPLRAAGHRDESARFFRRPGLNPPELPVRRRLWQLNENTVVSSTGLQKSAI